MCDVGYFEINWLEFFIERIFKMSKSKKELFLELAQPDKNGVSRWVSVTEFVGKYQGL
ncbi:hypothetical protein HpDR57_19170 [Helicobacter pylori]